MAWERLMRSIWDVVTSIKKNSHASAHNNKLTMNATIDVHSTPCADSKRIRQATVAYTNLKHVTSSHITYRIMTYETTMIYYWILVVMWTDWNMFESWWRISREHDLSEFVIMKMTIPYCTYWYYKKRIVEPLNSVIHYRRLLKNIPLRSLLFDSFKYRIARGMRNFIHSTPIH